MKLNKTIYSLKVSLFLMVLASVGRVSSQPVPGKDENIPFLVTFGKDSKTSWGDDDFYQIFFFTIPRDFKEQIYVRVFDPDTGGENDEIQDECNTQCLFSVYGGNGVDPDKNEESKGLVHGKNYKTGNLLAYKIFADESRYDNTYYTFGPFNPSEGDLNEKWDAYVFKIVCEGINGDDGNLYKYFLSRSSTTDMAIEGANSFTYNYTFRMWNNFKSVAHIYPFIDTGVISIKQRNFDWDNDGTILVVSRYKQGIPVPISGEDNWVESKILIESPEVGSSFDFAFHKRQETLIKNNNVVITLQNQRGEALEFFSSPIGGVPVFQSKIVARPATPKK